MINDGGHLQRAVEKLAAHEVVEQVPLYGFLSVHGHLLLGNPSVKIPLPTGLWRLCLLAVKLLGVALAQIVRFRGSELFDLSPYFAKLLGLGGLLY